MVSPLSADASAASRLVFRHWFVTLDETDCPGFDILPCAGDRFPTDRRLQRRVLPF
jgi:hypothetical protein